MKDIVRVPRPESVLYRHTSLFILWDSFDAHNRDKCPAMALSSNPHLPNLISLAEIAETETMPSDRTALLLRVRKLRK